MFKNNCQTLFARTQLKLSEFQVVKAKLDQLPPAANDIRLTPVTPAAIADREKAIALDKQLTSIALETGNLWNETEECYKKFGK